MKQQTTNAFSLVTENSRHRWMQICIDTFGQEEFLLMVTYLWCRMWIHLLVVGSLKERLEDLDDIGNHEFMKTPVLVMCLFLQQYSVNTQNCLNVLRTEKNPYFPPYFLMPPSLSSSVKHWVSKSSRYWKRSLTDQHFPMFSQRTLDPCIAEGSHNSKFVNSPTSL